MLYILACLGLASGAAIDKVGKRTALSGADSAADDTARTIVQDASKAAEQTIIICNAYAHAKPLDIINLHSQQRLGQESLSYKSCQDFRTSLQEGDRLEFKAGNASVGIFRATGIPKTRASLLLIPHRRDIGSLTAAFESHAFADTGNPQIAVVDAYRGREVSKVKIMDVEVAQSDGKEPPKQQRVEELRFNSVVALGVGKYQVALQTDDKKDVAKSPLQVSPERANYVIMRTGLQNPVNTSAVAFPQELVVYGEVRTAQSSAAGLRLSALAFALAGLVATAL